MARPGRRVHWSAEEELESAEQNYVLGSAGVRRLEMIEGGEDFGHLALDVLDVVGFGLSCAARSRANEMSSVP